MINCLQYEYVFIIEFLKLPEPGWIYPIRLIAQRSIVIAIGPINKILLRTN